MRRPDRQSGFTLIETMVAMAILMFGAVGMTKLFNVSYEMNGQARRATRASAIAQDLLENISLWAYQDNVIGTPLANVSTANDADIGDTAFAFQTDASPVADGLADHDEATITAMEPPLPASPPRPWASSSATGTSPTSTPTATG